MGRRDFSTAIEARQAESNMKIKIALLLFSALLGQITLASSDNQAQEDYDERLANMEQNFWLGKIPKMYLWKLRYLAEHSNELNGPPSADDLLESPFGNRARRGGNKFSQKSLNGLRRY